MPSTASCALPWPSLAEMQRATHTPSTNVARTLRLASGLFALRRHRAGFEQGLSTMPHWRVLFHTDARSYDPLVRAFMDRRWSAGVRAGQLLHDLQSASHRFGTLRCEWMAAGEQVPLWTLPGGGSVVLMLNHVTRREGQWALRLLGPAGEFACQVSFSFVHPQALMVGAVQGPRLADVAGLEAIRLLTRQAEGLRPAHLLLEVLRALCRPWQLDLLGVDPCHSATRRWTARELGVAFDYRGFWQEQGGARQADGTWRLPVERPARDLAEVPSKRRAMYRRRQQLLDEMRRVLAQASDLRMRTGPFFFSGTGAGAGVVSACSALASASSGEPSGTGWGAGASSSALMTRV